MSSLSHVHSEYNLTYVFITKVLRLSFLIIMIGAFLYMSGLVLLLCIT